MKSFTLKYGVNPNQKPACICREEGELPIRILNGNPGYINFLDAFNSWQLVKELEQATNLPAATSFKHVSPTSAAVGLPLSEKLKQACFVADVEGLDASPLACAYARARGTDRMSSYGDWVALSRACDETTARLLAREVSDGIIAPAYDPKALAILKTKKRGAYPIIQIDPAYEPEEEERRQVFGITFIQKRNDATIDLSCLERIVTEQKSLPEQAKLDLIIALITLKYTQSNSVAFAFGGQTIGVGAGQQSRIHCTRLAASKADLWQLRQADPVLSLPFRKEIRRADRDNAIDQYLGPDAIDLQKDDVWPRLFTERPSAFTEKEKKQYLASCRGISLASDAFFPFADNIERAHQSGVSYVAEPGGSIRDADLINLCNRYHMVLCFTGIRLFHH